MLFWDDRHDYDWDRDEDFDEEGDWQDLETDSMGQCFSDADVGL